MEAMKTNYKPPHEPRKVSFRDPAGQLYLERDKVTRVVNHRGIADLSFTLNSPKIQNYVKNGFIIPTKKVSSSQASQTLEHPKVFFPSYPDEWTPEMLNASADLTLELAQELLEEGIGLKDATPRNVLFEGTRAVFVDILSFEKRHPNDATWRPFEQFCRAFIYPMIAHRALGISLKQTFANHYHGPLPQELYQQLSFWQRFHPRYFSLVTIPGILSRWTEKAKQKGQTFNRFTTSVDEARFVLKILLKHLKKGMERIAPSTISNSHWKSYVDKNCPYSPEELQHKKQTIDSFLREQKINTVLDLGANTGTFSILAARQGKKVVAIDSDVSSMSQLYQHAKRESLDILPLHMDLLNPTPAKGWNGAETLSFSERAHHNFDVVFMLALIHHMMGDGLRLEEITAFAANITKKYLVLEYIPRTDQNFKNIISKRGDSVHQPSQEEFESTVGKHFSILKKETVSSSQRTLYFLIKN